MHKLYVQVSWDANILTLTVANQMVTCLACAVLWLLPSTRLGVTRLSTRVASWLTANSDVLQPAVTRAAGHRVTCTTKHTHWLHSKCLSSSGSTSSCRRQVRQSMWVSSLQQSNHFSFRFSTFLIHRQASIHAVFSLAASMASGCLQIASSSLVQKFPAATPPSRRSRGFAGINKKLQRMELWLIIGVLEPTGRVSQTDVGWIKEKLLPQFHLNETGRDVSKAWVTFPEIEVQQ